PEFFFMILISPDSVRTKARAYSFTQSGPASVYVLPEINSGRSQESPAMPMNAAGQSGRNVVIPGHLHHAPRSGINGELGRQPVLPGRFSTPLWFWKRSYCALP